ncbi:MAG: hypothetical protein ACLFUL_00500 [Desulfobacteraceae bacterium]
MITDTEIRLKGLKILVKYLGDVDAERFISLIQRERFDYTKWRQGLDEDLSIEDISKNAMTLRMKNTEQNDGADA